jgi:hypothetical protein
MTTTPSSTSSNVGKWDAWYAPLSSAADEGPRLYGDMTTYLIGAAFLADVDEVEDWGCGAGGFRRFCLAKYIGLDGSRTPFADKTVDLCTYRSTANGIMMRHILEHNYQWEKVLKSALESFRHKFCLILFTPFVETTHEIGHNRPIGIDVPDLAFSRADIERHFSGLKWRLMDNIRTQSQYHVEHVYFVWRD